MRAPSKLADPLELRCGIVVRNRLAKAAMSDQLGDLTGAPTSRHARLYGRWALGGAGLVISGNVMVDRRSIGEPRDVVIEDARDHEALRRWATAARRERTIALVQLNHPGRQALAGSSSRVVAPSSIKLATRGFATPRALKHDEIVELVQRYGRAARVVVEAGFDGVEVQAAHGYLVSQFLSPLANQREDAWGGDATRRRAFLIEVVRAVRAALGPDKVLAVKLNSADFQRGGFEEQESLQVVRSLDAEGVDLLEVSGGTFEAPAMSGAFRAPSTLAREAYFLTFAERVRTVAPELALMVTGGFRSGRAMDAAVTSGATDFVGLARPLALRPELPRELLQRPEATRSDASPRTTGIKRVDDLADLWWSQHQLRRLGAGKEPDATYGPRRAVVTAIVRDGINTVRRRHA